MTADDRDPQDEFGRSSRRSGTDRLSGDDTGYGAPVNPNWRGERSTGRVRRARGGLSGQDIALWLQYGGWRFVVAAVAILLVTAVMLILSQPTEPQEAALTTDDPPLTIRLTPVTDQPTVTATPPITDTQPIDAGTGVVVTPGQVLRVSGTGDQGLFLRPGPTQSNPAIKTLPEGSTVTVVGPDETAEGRVWKYIRDEQGSEGYAAGDFLVPID
ncbi:MAG TPA: SH3 domain-containing protein [Roseiflexaceae bacterium]|nr:SH3 domain-containing protein [Roseiflexaceae bacterium]HMP41832.1 SH3 domain-containing protein [Roseiflexaceae bacterium]